MTRRLAGVLLAAASAWAAAATPWADTRLPSPEQERVLQGLNGRRRAAGARPLAWDPVAASVLQELFRNSKRPDRGLVDARLQSGHGFDATWSWSSRAASDPEAAAESLDAELLGREYTHAGVALFDDVGQPGLQRVVVLAVQVAPLVGRHNANGPAGSYRFRCPACGKQVVYSVKQAPGEYFSCPFCKTIVSPYLDDTRGVLHWPTWYAAPYAPFATSNPFLAWQWVNQKVRYDHDKADHDLPGWQTAEETDHKGTGVCRDTAVLLEAWLRHGGQHARVATGLSGGEHHAWVVLQDGETRYLLESAFDGSMSRRYPPRLELATDYYPTKLQFDDAHVWLNRSQQLTRDYDSARIWLPVQEDP